MIKGSILVLIVVFILSSCTSRTRLNLPDDYDQIPTELALTYLNNKSMKGCVFAEHKSGQKHKAATLNEDLEFITITSYSRILIDLYKKNSTTGPFGFECNFAFFSEKDELDKAAIGLISIGIDCGSCDVE